MPFFRVALNGLCQGQEIVNLLWYRTTSPVPTILDFFDYAGAIGAEVYENVWDRALGLGMSDILPTTYRLVSMTIDGFGDDGLALTTTPHVNVVGSDANVAQPTNGAASYGVIAFNLEPAFGPGVGLPTKGYLAVGPVTQDQIGEDGRFTAAALEDWQEVAGRFAENIVTTSPAGLFYPVRVKFNESGLPFPIGYRDISSAVCRDVVKYRKSRLPTS